MLPSPRVSLTRQRFPVAAFCPGSTVQGERVLRRLPLIQEITLKIINSPAQVAPGLERRLVDQGVSGSNLLKGVDLGYGSSPPWFGHAGTASPCLSLSLSPDTWKGVLG